MDFNYVVEASKLLHNSGCPDIHLVTSQVGRDTFANFSNSPNENDKVKIHSGSKLRLAIPVPKHQGQNWRGGQVSAIWLLGIIYYKKYKNLKCKLILEKLYEKDDMHSITPQMWICKKEKWGNLVITYNINITLTLHLGLLGSIGWPFIDQVH